MPIPRAETKWLYETYAPVIHRRAYQLLRDEDEAWDAVHDVFVKLLGERFRFRRTAKLMTIVYRITTNECLDRIRAAKVRAEKAPEVRRARPAATRGHDASADAREFLLRLQAEVERRELPPRILQVATYAHLDGMPHTEIAKVLGVSRTTVQRALAQLEALARRLDAPAEQDS